MRRRQMKKQKKIIIISSLCLLLCLCVGYAAFNTQLSIRAKGNVKEKKMSDQLLENVVESGDGLYKDEYECRYFYRGANPNNYITFNDEDAGWRIMSVECDGTIKIIRNEGLNHTTWWAEFNVDEFNDWSDSPRCIYLNETYYNTLTDAAKNQIQAHDFGVESGTYLNYENMSAFIADENKTKWNGNIALNSMSEAVRMNSDTTKCGNFELHFASGKGNANGCEKTNWIFSTNTYIWWTLSNDGSSMGSAYVIRRYGGYAVSNQSADMRPTLYLRDDIKIIDGDGTQENPYIISE